MALNPQENSSTIEGGTRWDKVGQPRDSPT